MKEVEAKVSRLALINVLTVSVTSVKLLTSLCFKERAGRLSLRSDIFIYKTILQKHIHLPIITLDHTYFYVCLLQSLGIACRVKLN